ncbi:MAG: hypothetical protein ACYCVD_02790 [Desulfitobacteriaceae bacterium]
MLDFYSQLLEDGWTLNDIDEMDFYYYLDILIYKANKKEKKDFAYIDQVY